MRCVDPLVANSTLVVDRWRPARVSVEVDPGGSPGTTAFGPLTARWHNAAGLIANAAPEGVDERMRLAHGEAALATDLYPQSVERQATGYAAAAKAALGLHEWDEAVRLLSTAQSLYERTGPCPEWLLIELGGGAYQGGRWNDAVTAWAAITDRRTGRMGEHHPDTIRARANLEAMRSAM